MKGIILAGGAGTRLFPTTAVISKQLLPVYDKPMVYYPLSVLMLGGIREILVITTPQDQGLFRALMRDGRHLGLRITYATQPQPRGIADAFIVGRDFIAQDNVALILGDNVFFGHGLPELMMAAVERRRGATIFGYRVSDPQRYGVVEIDNQGNPISIEEKPKMPRSPYAVTGLYFYDNRVVDIAATLRPSVRGEIEITDINRIYLEAGELTVQLMGRGFAWLDMGTHAALLEASQFVQILEQRQGLRICCPEEVALLQQFISPEEFLTTVRTYPPSAYRRYLMEAYERFASPQGDATVEAPMVGGAHHLKD
jgi:glucose-1-phosphate thymidylyltransferase